MAGLTVDAMNSIDEKELGELLRPVAFYNNKARNLKEVAFILKEKAQGNEIIDIPDTFDGLLKLPGVGPKVANIVMTCAWNKCVL